MPKDVPRMPALIAVAQGIIIFFLSIDTHMSVMRRDLAARRTSGGMENIG